jgi:hypothetical protein
VLDEYPIFQGMTYGRPGDTNVHPGSFQIETSKPIGDGWQLTVQALSSDVSVISYGGCNNTRLFARAWLRRRSRWRPVQLALLGGLPAVDDLAQWRL